MKITTLCLAFMVAPMLAFAGIDRDVADPWYTGNFDETYADVVTGCTALLESLDRPVGDGRKGTER